MELVGYLSAILIGISLGLIGGGGSILTVPVLLYLFHLDEKLATAYSLFVVGATALVGGIQKQRQGFADLKTVAIFGIPALAAVFFTRYIIVPTIPDVIFAIGSFEFTRRILMMGLFSILMMVASMYMIRGSKGIEVHNPNTHNYPLIILEGLVVGILTGLVGAGGGFLIIPALVILGKLPMKLAVGTSLLIIAVKSLIGFVGDVLLYDIDWQFLMIFTAMSMVGIFIGNILSHKVHGDQLKKGFGWFVLVMGIYILIKELFLM
ncbi:MAG: sulfite exporter TauE/SafE family protein [Bacteroidetes bacterium]|nr:sulfite exporter TauE/SafE family protein [Bacteroidota bacterium]